MTGADPNPLGQTEPSVKELTRRAKMAAKLFDNKSGYAIY
jgi:hypothetical protein